MYSSKLVDRSYRLLTIYGEETLEEIKKELTILGFDLSSVVTLEEIKYVVERHLGVATKLDITTNMEICPDDNDVDVERDICKITFKSIEDTIVYCSLDDFLPDSLLSINVSNGNNYYFYVLSTLDLGYDYIINDTPIYAEGLIDKFPINALNAHILSSEDFKFLLD